MQRVVAIFVAAASFLFLCGEAAVILANGPDYQKQVASSSAAVLVAYLSGPPADELTELLTKVDEKLSAYQIRTAFVDCKLSSNKKNCAGKVPGSLALYLEKPAKNPYTGLPFRINPLSYTGSGLDLSKIERWIGKNFPNRVELLSATLPECDPAANIPSLILFSQKESVTMLLKSIAFSFSPRLKVVQAHGVPVELVKKKYTESQVDALPILGLCSASSSANSLTIYTGDLKNRTEIVAWIESTTSIAENEAVLGAGDGNPPRVDEPLLMASIKKISSSNFSTTSLDEASVWVIAVVSGSSGADGVAAGPGWDKIASWCEGVIRAAVLICSNSSTTEESWGSAKFCQRDLPYVVVLPHGSSSSRRKIHNSANPHVGNHIFAIDDLDGIKKYATDSLPEVSVAVMPEEGIQEFIASGHQKSVMSVIILSDKASGGSTPLLRNLALSLKEYAHLAFVSNPSKQFLQNIGNPALPTAIAMFLMQSGDVDKNPAANFQVVVYDSNIFGPMKFHSLQAFILQSYSRSTLAAAKFANKDAQEDLSMESQQKELVTIATEAEWNEHCGPGFRGICAIGLVKAASPEGGARADLEALNTVMSSMGRSGAAFKFVVLDAECQNSFANRFDAQYEHLPALVAYSPSKSRYAIFKSSFVADDLRGFLSRITSGKASTISIPQRPFLSTECDGQNKSIPVEESIESASEAEAFLEEIRQEEAKRKLEMKKEIQEEEAKAKAAAAEAAKAATEPRKIIRKVKKKKSKKAAASEL